MSTEIVEFLMVAVMKSGRRFEVAEFSEGDHGSFGFIYLPGDAEYYRALDEGDSLDRWENIKTGSYSA